MIRYVFNKMLMTMASRYEYDVRYMQAILSADLKAFIKFMGFQTMSSHGQGVPVGPLYAARIRAIIWDDCGPCAQLIVNMALEAKLNAEIVSAIVDRDLDKLPDEIVLVIRFTELVLQHNPEADALRDEILALWGKQGLITIGYSISASRVYPALKYTLGYGKACSRIRVGKVSLAPGRL